MIAIRNTEKYTSVVKFFMGRIIIHIIIAALLAIPYCSIAQELYPVKLSNKLWHDEQRELRYKPDGKDFVITNGNRLFTRALYGSNTAFRVEAGDRPEFALYMPGMGGNFKLGIANGKTSKWLTSAKTITARYNAGSMIYTIEDPLFGSGKLLLEVLALADTEGFIIKAHTRDLKTPVTLFWAFGGASGKNFSRSGDMGPDPESNFYLKPENCKDNKFSIDKNSFSLKYGKDKTLVGTFPVNAILKIADATRLSSPQEFYNSQADETPALAGQLTALTDADYYFTIYNPSANPTISYPDTPDEFTKADVARKAIADRITINTPDPYINTIGGTLAVASDAIWETPSYMHGAIGWRMRLNGWRGAYSADVLGWHDRAKTHLESYAKSQVTAPASGPVVADTVNHLARSLEKIGTGMFTSGYISRNPDGQKIVAHHYDMNLVYIDILLRHYMWTGDTDFLKETWPVLKRHLQWETRNFDPDGDGLYDAYAAIWASDALQYSGGGVTHSSAYNYFAFTKAAQIATIIGEGPAPYSKEADRILKAMNSRLWMKDTGVFAEFKDALGNQLLHPAPALWTVYHSIDSEAVNPFQAYQSLRYIDNETPHIPVKAKGLKDEGYYTLSTTKWMPYEWSLNNSALAESMHTALANWQGGRTDEAFKLFKSEVLASMYLGGSPGNFVQISHYDAIRGEAYRDFADPIGIFSRALVEGLFGIVPDALNDTLTVRPGLPSSWEYASFSTPDISFDFKRINNIDTYILIPKFPKKLNLKFQVIAKGQVKDIIVNGKPVDWKNIDAAVGKPVIEINVPAADKYNMVITWQGAEPVLPHAENTYATGSTINQTFAGATVIKIYDPQNALTDIVTKPSTFSANVTAVTGNYTVFVQLQQGALSWWMPLCFKVKKPVTLISGNDTETESSTFRLQNNTTHKLNATISINGYKTKVSIRAGKISNEIDVPIENLITGTSEVVIKMPDGAVITEYFYNWQANTKGRLEAIDISKDFNDNVTQIFRNKYLSPRPQTTTLQLPWQGIGDWPHPLKTFDVDDSGLRKLAGKKNTITLPQGIVFSTPGLENANNIMYTSQWDNYPDEKTIPLTGSASHAWFLMAGSTNPMQSQLDNGALIVNYTDGTTDTLILRNPETWWPIDQDYYTDGFAFALKRPRPIRVHLKTGLIVSGQESQANYNGKEIEGGAATVLDMPLNTSKTLKSITLKTLANDVVIGLMGITLLR